MGEISGAIIEMFAASVSSISQPVNARDWIKVAFGIFVFLLTIGGIYLFVERIFHVFSP